MTDQLPEQNNAARLAKEARQFVKDHKGRAYIGDDPEHYYSTGDTLSMIASMADELESHVAESAPPTADLRALEKKWLAQIERCEATAELGVRCYPCDITREHIDNLHAVIEKMEAGGK